MGSVYVQPVEGGWQAVGARADGTYQTSDVYANQKDAEDTAYRWQQTPAWGGGGTPTPRPTPTRTNPYGGLSIDDQILLANLNREATGLNNATSRANAQLSADTQMKLGMVQDAYVRYRLQMLEIPEMQLTDERDRHQMALNAAMFEAEQTGWIEPNMGQQWSKRLESSLSTYTGYGGTNVANNDITQIRSQLQAAGWGGGSDEDAVKTFLQTSGADPSQQGLVQRVQGAQAAPAGTAAGTANVSAAGGPLTGVPGLSWGFTGAAPTTPTGTGGEIGIGNTLMPSSPTTPTQSWTNQQGMVPTMAGAGQLANPRTLAGSLSLLGDPNAAATAGSLPNAATRNPTLAMQKMQGDPRMLAQSLIAGGYSPQNAAAYLTNTPFVQNIANLAGGQSQMTALNGSPFAFAGGQKLDPRQTLRYMQENDPRLQTIQGLQSFSGRDPVNEMSKFLSFLPKGNTSRVGMM